MPRASPEFWFFHKVIAGSAILGYGNPSEILLAVYRRGALVLEGYDPDYWQNLFR